MADDHRAAGGALYRLDRDGGTELILDGLTISNGLGWSIDGSTMYLVDSGARVIHAFAFDAERGTIADGRILVTVAEDVGAPDGMTVDADGDLWVAIYGGGRVQRYSSAGVLLEELFVPAEQSTSCAFAGPGLNRLYVTTATEGWSDERRRPSPVPGSCTASTPTHGAGRRRHFVRRPRGGRRWHRDDPGARGALAQGLIDPSRWPAKLARTRREHSGSAH